MEYIGTCINLDGVSIGDMVEKSCCLSYREAVTECPAIKQDFKSCYPPIERDACVSFGKSRYNGLTCVYVRHGAIEHVYVKGL